MALIRLEIIRLFIQTKVPKDFKLAAVRQLEHGEKLTNTLILDLGIRRNML